MLLALSPAKTLDLESDVPELPTTKPRFAADAWRLVKRLRGLSLTEVSELMHISGELAALNVERYHQFRARPAPTDVRPAVLTFAGDVYRGLDARSLDAASLNWAQGTVRVLSGLYGVLRPLDLIQPYRLDMGTRLVTDRGRTLYDFWGDRIAKALRADLAAGGGDVVINLASQEYFKAVDTRALKARVVECVFEDLVAPGKYRIVSFHAKAARGLMARYVIDNRLSEPEGLTEFDSAGYRYSESLSSADRLIFRRARDA